MHRHVTSLGFFGLILLAAFAALSPSSALAQDDPPADEEQPAGGPPPQADNAQPADKPAELPPPRDPFIKDLLATEPKTPADFVRTISILIDFKHASHAAPLLKKLAEQMLDDDALAALVKQFGEDTIFKIGLEASLQPEAGDFMNKALAAAANKARDPQRLAMLVDQLKDPSPRVRAEAVSGLAGGGTPSIEALLTVLADAGREAEHAEIRKALVTLRGNSREPLLGALVTQEPALKLQIVDVLGRIGSRTALKFLIGDAVAEGNEEQLRVATQEAVRRLLGRLPSREEAVAYLTEQTKLYLHANPPVDTDFEGNVIVYRWDDGQKSLITAKMPARQAALVTAARVAASLHALEPSDVNVRRLYLTALLQAASYFNGLDKPLPKDNPAGAGAAAAVGAEGLADVLAYSLEHNQPVTATAATRLLGQVGSADLLQTGPEADSLLVTAARHPNRRVRFAGVEAIANLKPQASYRGRSDVERSLAYLASYSGLPRVLVGDTRLRDGRTLAGILNELGYEADVATTAREFLQKAAASPDYVFALADARLPGVDSSDILVQRLQQDDRSAALPLGLIVPIDVYDTGRRTEPPIAGVGEKRLRGPIDEVERIASKYDHVSAFIRPTDASGMEFQVNMMMEKTGPNFVAHEERMQQATQALGWIAAMSADPNGLYDFQQYDRALEAPLFDPELSPHAAPALAGMGTSASQQALVNLGKLATFPEAARQAAAGALGQSIERFGLLLPDVDSAIVLETPLLRPALLDHLASHAEHDSQAYLADLASDGRRALELRQAVAAAFVRSVQKHGVLLDSAETFRQYERYNASEMLDQETQELLASMLDALEAAPDKAVPREGEVDMN